MACSAMSLARPYGLIGSAGVSSVTGSFAGLPYTAHVLENTSCSAAPPASASHAVLLLRERALSTMATIVQHGRHVSCAQEMQTETRAHATDTPHSLHGAQRGARLPRLRRLHRLEHVDNVGGDVVVVAQRLRHRLACAPMSILRLWLLLCTPVKTCVKVIYLVAESEHLEEGPQQGPVRKQARMARNQLRSMQEHMRDACRTREH